jgi:hypothetical protein
MLIETRATYLSSCTKTIDWIQYLALFSATQPHQEANRWIRGVFLPQLHAHAPYI